MGSSQGFGSAWAVVYANPSTDDRARSGALLWVDRGGSFRVDETSGLYLGTVKRRGAGVEFADTGHLYRVGRRNVERAPLPRAMDMGHEIVATRTGPVHVFNSGLDPDDDDYMWDFATVTDSGVATYQLKGDLLGVGACNGQLYALMGPWLNAGRSPKTELVSLTLVGDEFAAKNLGATSLSARDGYEVGCRAGKLLFATTVAKLSRISEVDPDDPAQSRVLFHAQTRREVTDHCGMRGDRSYSWAYDSHVLFVDNVADGTRQQIPVEGLASDAACSVQGSSVVFSNRASGGELQLIEVDGVSGEVIHVVTVSGAADFLEDKRLMVLTAPALLP